MTHVSIIGNGNMGPVIADLVTRGDNTVEILGRDDRPRSSPAPPPARFLPSDLDVGGRNP
ncbi:hypothetical protein [Kineosporia sp. NBRC 101731]|uniref:hypothetical protein n=1 Tax=Kineosporia sp. NBRC 101731 TaxID=3032199 RepID=UPI00249FE3EC|nr:hypothetical protein [Kineosporia sp. NBRC 101731]GLY32707.1 hypothetical protein Kisp02_60720 [Kineosporia sp. NBRC 101731]